jgi:predicted acylesterase/phospholipase RssA
VPPAARRDVALVLSGGGINGVLLELGFLKRLSESTLWPRVGWIYGTSAGALAGTMAALERLSDLEDFLLGIQPQEAFRPRAVWQFPGGLHDFTLPTTVADRIGSPKELGAELAAAEIELVVYATDVSDYPEGDESRDFELEYSSRTTEPEVMGRAILASAAISGLVLPIQLDGRIATDGTSRSNTRTGTATSLRSQRSGMSRAIRRRTPRSSSGRGSASSAFVPFPPCGRSWRRCDSRRSGRREANRRTTASSSCG